jgi:integrase
LRVPLKGIAKVNKTLADGTKRVYLYAWRGGPLLKDAEGNPLQPGDKRIAKAYADCHESDKKKSTDTLQTLFDEFKRSSEYTTKSEKTRRGYDRYIKAASAYEIKPNRKMADLPLDAIQDPSARGIFKGWRDTMADKPRTADYAWVTLARVLSVAKDNGRIKVNVCERGGRLYTADRAEKIWTADDIAAMSGASEPLRMALIMALWTGQRQGDLLRVPWSAYDGKRIKIRQGKTGARVTIPVGAVLKEALDQAALDKKGPQILTNSRGRAWTEDGFRASWGKACNEADIDDLTVHDLRGTAVTRLALAGCNNSQIAAITGHALKDVDSILDAHYLGGRVELAEQAMAKLEQHEARTKIAN